MLKQREVENLPASCCSSMLQCLFRPSLGTTSFLYFFRRTLRITSQQARAHMHVLGKTGSGKSYFLASLFLSLFAAGLPVTLLDPHGDLARAGAQPAGCRGSA